MKALIIIIVLIALACLLFLFMKPGDSTKPTAPVVAPPQTVAPTSVSTPTAVPPAMTKPATVTAVPPPPPVTAKPTAPAPAPPAAPSPAPGSVGSVLDYATGYTALKARKRSGEKINNLSTDFNKRVEEEAAK